MHTCVDIVCEHVCMCACVYESELEILSDPARSTKFRMPVCMYTCVYVHVRMSICVILIQTLDFERENRVTSSLYSYIMHTYIHTCIHTHLQSLAVRLHSRP
jgi:hypothetical protein